jgi:glycosyltransferase involved in cell wall biosynthesis
MAKKHEITLLIPSQYNYSIKGVEVYHFYSSNIPLVSPIISFLSIVITYLYIILVQRPQIASYFLPNQAALPIFLISKLCGIKTVMNLRGLIKAPSLLDLKLLTMFSSMFFVFTDYVVCNSRLFPEQYEKVLFFGKRMFRSKKFIYIPNGINVKIWGTNEFQVQQDKPYDLIFLGNIGNSSRLSVKGFDVLHQALQLYENTYQKKLKVCVIGDFNLNLMHKEIKSFNPDYFDFRGIISKKREIKSYLSNSRVFVLSSRSEGMSNALMEALCFGIPSISTDVGASSELIDSGYDGFIVPPRNPEELSNKIHELLTNESLQKTFSERSKEKLAERYSWEKIYYLAEKMYIKILKN